MKIMTVSEMKKQRKAKKGPLPKRKSEPGRDGKPILLEDAKTIDDPCMLKGPGGTAIIFNSNAGALEALKRYGNLNDPLPDGAGDEAMKVAHQWGEVRRHMLTKLSDMWEKAHGSPVKSVDWGGAGGGGFGPRSLSAATLEGLWTYGYLMAAIPLEGRRLLEKVIVHDYKIWEVKSRTTKRKILEAIRLALDLMAFHIRSAMHREIHRCVGPKRLQERWPDALAWVQEQENRIRCMESAKRKAAATSSPRMASSPASV